MVRPYSTCESLSSSVAQEIAAVSGPMEDVVTPESTGGGRALLTVTETAAEVAVLPAASRATAGGGCEPVGTPGGFPGTRDRGPVTPAPRVGLSRFKWTPTTPTVFG